MTLGDRCVVFEGTRRVSPGEVRSGAFRIRGGRVTEGRSEEGPFVIRRDGDLIFPGLVNAHDHLTLNAFPRPASAGPHDDASDWIEALQPVLSSAPFRSVRALDERLRAWHGGLKNLLAGVTTVAHHDPWIPAMGEAAFPVRVLFPYGWCHSLRLAGRYGPEVRESRGATPAGARWFIHLAEGTGDEAAGELEALERLGAFGADAVLVHGVGLGDSDISRVLSVGAGVVWCPASNIEVLGRTLDPEAFREGGKLALGTDSRLSGARDLLAELSVAREVSGLGEPALLSLVTDGAARVLGLRNVGHLDEGASADFVIVSGGGGDPRGRLTGLPRAELRAVVLGGAPRIADPDFLSWFEVMDVPVRRARLDGVPKLVDARVFDEEAAALEPGLELVAR